MLQKKEIPKTNEFGEYFDPRFRKYVVSTDSGLPVLNASVLSDRSIAVSWPLTGTIRESLDAFATAYSNILPQGEYTLQADNGIPWATLANTFPSLESLAAFHLPEQTRAVRVIGPDIELESGATWVIRPKRMISIQGARQIIDGIDRLYDKTSAMQVNENLQKYLKSI